MCGPECHKKIKGACRVSHRQQITFLLKVSKSIMNLLQRSSTVKSFMYAYMYALTQTQTHEHTPSNTHTHTYIDILTLTQSHSHIHTITYILAHTDSHTYILLTQTHAHTFTLSQMHTHTHTHRFYSIPLFVYGCYVCGQRSGLCSQLWILRRLCLLFLLLHGLLSRQRRVKVSLDLGMQQPLRSTMQLSKRNKVGRRTGTQQPVCSVTELSNKQVHKWTGKQQPV